MTAQEKILQVADAIRIGKKIRFRQFGIGRSNGWAELRFLGIDFLIEDAENTEDRKIVELIAR